MGLIGVWLGMCVAWSCAGAIYAFLLARTDWEEEVKHAEERNDKALDSIRPVAATLEGGDLENN